MIFLDGKVELKKGDCLDVVRSLETNSIDAIVTDPPYAFVSITKRYGGENAKPTKAKAFGGSMSGFMGKKWDTGERAFAPEFWGEIYRILKPGGHVAAFSATRTYHKLATAIEESGFEIRDQLAWAYGSGFPKSHDVSKQLDKRAGHWRGRAGEIVSENDAMASKNYERTDKGEPITDDAKQWSGWGTALKPAWEPIALARKPLIGSVADNVLEHGTGAINIDGCRVGDEGGTSRSGQAPYGESGWRTGHEIVALDAGRFPANILHDGSDQIVEAFPDGAHRFFYSAKADATDRIGSKHPTVKPVDLMQWLVRLITPRGGLVLDPFAGTGTTGEAAWREGCRAILIEREEEYQADIARRMSLADAGPVQKQHAISKHKNNVSDAGPLFGAA